MSDFNQNIDQAKDLLNLEEKDMQKMPSMLNVLTILTYIGCALAAIGAVYTFFTIGTSYKMIGGMSNTADGLPGNNKMVQSIVAESANIVKKQYENRMLIFALTFVATALCFYGAMQMRNLKKQGYLLYVIGELIPILTFAVFVGFGGLFTGLSMVFSILFAAVFIILYTTQRKYLVN